MDPVLSKLISGWVIFFFAVYLPGPNTFYVASVGTKGKKNQIIGAALGTAFGSFSWCLLSTTGTSILISNLFYEGFLFLKFLASIYMLYLAFNSARQYFSTSVSFIKSVNDQSLLSCIKSSYFVAMTNPKAFAFWSALATLVFETSLEISIAFIFSVGSLIISFANYSVIGFLFGLKKFSDFFNKPKSIINLVFATLFLFVAVEVWVY